MRIHVSADVHSPELYAAADAARVGLQWSDHGSRKAYHALDVKLTGSSNRRPNGGNRGAGDDYAATWDQWGVFLAAIFDLDPNASCWAYTSAADFHFKTSGRFEDGWPADAHGDHRFEFDGVPGSQKCTKCTATRTW